MKKHLTLSFSLLTTIIMSQTSTNWLTNGNNTSGSNYFGTNNNNPIIFKANGSEVFRLRPNGYVKIMQFDDNLNPGIVLTNKNGVLQKLNYGTASQVLFGNGTWGSLPASRLSASCFSLAPFWTMGGDNFSTSLGVTEASIGTCNNYDFIIKANNTNSMWFKPDGTIGFGTNIPSNTGGKEFKFNDGALRLSGANTYGGPMIVFDGGVSPYGDWGIEYAPSAFTKPGLNFWKPFGSSNANNYLLFLADDGMVGVGTSNPSSRLTVDAWNDNGLTIQTVNTKKAISTYNKTTSKETFVVNADGKTIIGSAPATTDTMLVVNGLLKTNDLSVNGTFSTSRLKMGIIGTSDIGVSLTTLSSGARLLSFGTYEPLELSRTCIKPYSLGMISRFGDRVIITKSFGSTTSSNVLDLRNDSLNGYIDYGYDVSIHPRLIDTTGAPVIVAPVPSLKINSACTGDVEIAKGGGFVSAGNYFEVGNPIRNGAVVSNINATGSRIGLRVTKRSIYPASYTGVTNEYNTQLFVNRNFVRALSVFNTVTNASGDETFAVYGDGRTAIGSSYVAPGYKLAVNGKIITEEVVVQLRASWPDYVFSNNYNLKPLSEIEEYIKANNHLQNIPSAIEIEKNGVSIGNIVAKQMEKIEELTLYLIEQHKQIEELKKQMEALKK